jgi:hypothetical protein
MPVFASQLGLRIGSGGRRLRGGFSFRAKKELGFSGEIWQRGFSEVGIRDDDAFRSHRSYIPDAFSCYTQLSWWVKSCPDASSCLTQSSWWVKPCPDAFSRHGETDYGWGGAGASGCAEVGRGWALFIFW